MEFTDLTSKNPVKLIIQGVEIPTDVMSGYTYYDAKTYFTQPERSSGGEIVNLNSYATSLTPRIKFWFDAMPIGAYRILGKIAKQYNEVTVTAYDMLEDVYVTKKMYFATQEFPDIFFIGLETARLRNQTFELIGTNASVEEISLIYNSNAPTIITSGKTTNYGIEVMVGDYDEEGIDPTTFTNSGFKLNGWNTEPDGSGLSYQTNEIITLTTTTILYAQWQPNTTFVLSYDYQGATSGAETLSKEVIQNNAIGSLPSPIKNGYIFSGWFTLLGGQGTQITELSVFIYGKNITIYAYWVGVDNSIFFNNNGGIGSMQSFTVKSGEKFKLPKSTFTKPNNVFIGWTNQESGMTVIYQDEQEITMPITSLTLYALYDLAYILTYDTNGGINNGFQDYGKTFKTAIYTHKENNSLVGWYNESSFITAVTFPLTISLNKTIYARWIEYEE